MTAKPSARIEPAAAVVLVACLPVAAQSQNTTNDAESSGAEIKVIRHWASAGAPEVDRKYARQFMAEYPDTRVQLTFLRYPGEWSEVLRAVRADTVDIPASALRDYVVAGLVQPLDKVIEARRDRKASIVTASPDGPARLVRFAVHPRDPLLRHPSRDPAGARRLLAMHGKPVGLTSVMMPYTLTYNKRVFRKAAGLFPGRGLLDDRGEPVRPRSWIELYEKAKLLTRYGRAAAERQGKDEPVSYGLVLQGQRPRDFMRGIRALAGAAGTIGFNFHGDTKSVQASFARDDKRARQAARRYAGRPIGCFEYHHPAYLGAFALLWKAKSDGLVLPGTEKRHFEDARLALARGQATMLLDGWHAALIGAMRVPSAAKDLGSWPVPPPYRTREEQRELNALLGLQKGRIALPRSAANMPLTRSGRLTVVTRGCEHPGVAWDWMRFSSTNDKLLKEDCRRGTVPPLERALKHVSDPEWFPYPYQKQVASILRNHCALWPRPPQGGKYLSQRRNYFLHKAFQSTEGGDLPAVLRRVYRDLRDCSRRANERLAWSVSRGLEHPEWWTFPEFDPRRAEQFAQREYKIYADEALNRELETIRKRLPDRGAE